MSCEGTYTIGDFLKGISPLVTDDAVLHVCSKRGLIPSTEFPFLSQKDRDLLEGTMYYWLSNLPTGSATEKVSDGNFSHSEGGWTVSKSNIEEWMRKYRSLFEKWGEELLDRSRIRILNL